MSRKPKSSASGESSHSEAVEAVLEKTSATGASGAEGAAAGADIPAGGINDKIRHLIRLSKEQGYLTFDDINEALPESVENQEEIDNVLSILQNLEIEILEPDQVEDYKARQEEAEEEPHEDAVCMCCFDGTSVEGNRILFCDGCNGPLHQRCNDGPILPRGDLLAPPA
eukprot:gene55508-76060_t